MKKLRKITAMLLCAIMCATVLHGAVFASEESGSKVLSIGAYSDTFYCMQFDPYGYATPACASPTACSALLYDYIFFIAENGKIETNTLESWSWSEDSSTLTMTVKDGIYFTNGQQLTADDILFSIEQFKNSATCFLSQYYQQFDIEDSTISEDGMTLNLKTYDVYGLAMIFLSQIAITNREWFEEMGGSWENINVFDPTQACGSGPYICESFIPQSQSVYKLRDDYWGFEQGVEWPVFDEIDGYFYTDQTTMAVDLETGKLDIAINLSTQDYDRLKENTSGVTAYGVDSNAVVWVALGNNNEYLQDARVREAICCAVDTSAVTDAAVGSLGILADSYLGTNQYGYTGGCNYEYNPEHSRELLKEAGINDGDITLTYAVMADSIQQATAETFQFFLGQIGINVEIVNYDRASWYAAMNNLDFTNLIWYELSGGSPSGDPGQGAAPYWTKAGMLPYYFHRDEYDEYLTAASKLMDVAAKSEYYTQFEHAVHDNFDVIPLYQQLKAVGYNADKIAPNPIMTIGSWPYLIKPVE